MPKTSRDSANSAYHSKRMQWIMAWNEIIPNLSTRDMVHLIKFRKKYGLQAMIKRATSIIRKRNLVPKSYLATIKSKLDFLSSMQMIWKYTPKLKKLSLVEKLRRAKKQNFVNDFARSVEPIVRSMLTLDFTHNVLPQYLTPSEISRLTGDGRTEESRQDLINLLERRSGQTITQLMKDTQHKVERDMLSMWSTNLKDMQILAKNPDLAKRYSEAMAKGDVSAVARLYMEGHAAHV